MRATRTLIQLFLPRMALRRKRAPAATTTAHAPQPNDVRVRLSPTCESPELRRRALAVSPLETIPPVSRLATPEIPEPAAHLSVLAEHVLTGEPILVGSAMLAVDSMRREVRS